MRVQPLFEVNTHQQQNPYFAQNAGSALSGKTVSGTSFKDCLRTYFQQMNDHVISRQTESLIAGLSWGYFPSLRMPFRPGPTLKGSANHSLSDQ